MHWDIDRWCITIIRLYYSNITYCRLFCRLVVKEQNDVDVGPYICWKFMYKKLQTNGSWILIALARIHLFSYLKQCSCNCNSSTIDTNAWWWWWSWWCLEEPLLSILDIQYLNRCVITSGFLSSLVNDSTDISMSIYPLSGTSNKHLVQMSHIFFTLVMTR